MTVHKMVFKAGKEMELDAVVIESERLRLVPWSMEYAQDIFTNFTENVVKYMSPNIAESIDVTKNVINSYLERMDNQTALAMIILDKETGEFFGSVGVESFKEEKVYEFGIWIKEAAQGKGYGKEAVHRLKEWADENLEAEYYFYPVDKRNSGSVKIAESLEGTVISEGVYERSGGREALQTVSYKIMPGSQN